MKMDINNLSIKEVEKVINSLEEFGYAPELSIDDGNASMFVYDQLQNPIKSSQELETITF